MKRIDQERSGQVLEKLSPDVEDHIRRRAYEIYESRGVAVGSEVEDWLQAESEILEKKNVSKAA